MRGPDSKTEALFKKYVTPESLVPKDHPLRAIERWLILPWKGWTSSLTASIPLPVDNRFRQKQLKAQLLMILYSIRSTDWGMGEASGNLTSSGKNSNVRCLKILKLCVANLFYSFLQACKPPSLWLKAYCPISNDDN
jgi:hypothetical protein